MELNSRLLTEADRPLLEKWWEDWGFSKGGVAKSFLPSTGYIVEKNNKPVVSISISKDLIEQSVSASSLAKLIGSNLNGGGGGKDDFATAGASTDFSLNEIRGKVQKLITSEMEKL